MGKNKNIQTPITYESERVINSENHSIQQDFHESGSHVVDFDNFSKQSSNTMMKTQSHVVNQQLQTASGIAVQNVNIQNVQHNQEVQNNSGCVSKSDSILNNTMRTTPNNPAQSNVAQSINNINSQSQQIKKKKKENEGKNKNDKKQSNQTQQVENVSSKNMTLYMGEQPQMNGGITVHSTTRDLEETLKRNKKKKFILLVGVIAILLLLASLFILLLDMGVIELPKKIDAIYNSYPYNYTDENIKFQYDKKTNLYFTSDENLVSIYSENKKNYIEISTTSIISPEEVKSEFDKIENEETIKESNNGLMSSSTQFDGKNNGENCKVFVKELSSGSDYLIAVLVIGDDANEVEVNTMKKIYETAIYSNNK